MPFTFPFYLYYLLWRFFLLNNVQYGNELNLGI